MVTVDTTTNILIYVMVHKIITITYKFNLIAYTKLLARSKLYL